MGMLEKHNRARRMLSMNTALFTVSSLALGVDLIWGSVQSLFGAGAPGWLGVVLDIGLWGAFGLTNIRGAWTAFARSEYEKSQRKGMISWLVPLAMIIIDMLF